MTGVRAGGTAAAARGDMVAADDEGGETSAGDAKFSGEGAAARDAGAAASARVLVVADGALLTEVKCAIEGAGAIARAVRRGTDAAEAAAAFQPELVLCDGELVHPSAAEVIAAIRKEHACPVALLVASPTGDSITLASRADADIVLVRPLSIAALRRILPASAAGVVKGHAELPDVVIGASGPMREVWRLATVAARSESSVVVRGETGAGKEVVARALHRFSPRRERPFVAVNCAALSETLLESELFGHEKGAFTGAVSQHKGRFELAHGGTLFLDEIGDLPLGLQVKLLRVLQEHSFERVGGSHSIAVDVRIVAATHHDLSEAVARGRFRADLYYRLNVLSIHVPPLRERRADILELWQHMIAEAAAREGRAPAETSRSVERILLRHGWPGNVRELYNVAQHALTVASGPILPADLPDYLGARAHTSAAPGLCGMRLDEIERLAILETYEAVGTIQRAADMLGISPRKIHYRLKEYKNDGWRPPRPLRQHDDDAASDKMRVLLAEDDDELRLALTDVLRREGFEVVAVANGRALLEQLGASLLLECRDAPADIIISDVRMPGLTGMQLLESVRGRGWRTPVVLISGVADDDIHRRAKALGAELLDKPIDLIKLRAAIDGAIGPGPTQGWKQ